MSMRHLVSFDTSAIWAHITHMSYLTQAQYYYRRESAAQTMTANRESCDTLTEEQHDALAEVCRMRHELHGDSRSLYASESSNHDRWIAWLGCDESDENGKINDVLVSAGLPRISAIAVPCDIPCDGYEADEDEVDEDGCITDEALSARLADVGRFAESVNTRIEKYLKEIDTVHGTSYCPSGALRV